jgi:hypothetical protein
MVIWFCVSVPLLSVHTTDTVPSVSISARRLTSTPRCASRCTAMARDNVVIGDNPSGTAATRMPMASTKASRRGMPTCKLPTMKTSAPRPTAMAEMTRLTRRSSSCNGLGSSRTAWVRWAIRPNCVSMPVA